MPTNDSSLPIVTSMQHFAHHGLRQAYSLPDEARDGQNAIEVTIGSEESFVSVLDRPKQSSYYQVQHA